MGLQAPMHKYISGSHRAGRWTNQVGSQDVPTYPGVHHRITSPCQVGRLYIHCLILVDAQVSVIVALKNRCISLRSP